jgi:dipeptidyl aminopeptidase/acylaminoacyl peptidase
MRAADTLVALGLADPARMAAAGASYGGYLVSWIAGHTDRFRCLVNHAGVFDSWNQYASDVTQGRARSFGGEPWDRAEELDRWSPARYAKGFVTPMLVTHGERDYRVPVGQGLECYSILQAKGVPSRLVCFPDENHWILKPTNSLLWYAEVGAWLDRWLRP